LVYTIEICLLFATLIATGPLVTDGVIIRHVPAPDELPVYAG
jgi:hypothetical protein